jgi:hypothetical protein
MDLKSTMLLEADTDNAAGLRRTKEPHYKAAVGNRSGNVLIGPFPEKRRTP